MYSCIYIYIHLYIHINVYKICIHTCLRIHIYIYIHRPSWPLKASSVNQSSSCNNLLQTSYSGPFPKERKYKEIKQIPQTALSKFHRTYCSPHLQNNPHMHTRICVFRSQNFRKYLGLQPLLHCIHVYLYLCVYECVCVCMYMCVYMYMHKCMCICEYKCIYLCISYI